MANTSNPIWMEHIQDRMARRQVTSQFRSYNNCWWYDLKKYNPKLAPRFDHWFKLQENFTSRIMSNDEEQFFYKSCVPSFTWTVASRAEKQRFWQVKVETKMWVKAKMETKTWQRFGDIEQIEKQATGNPVICSIWEWLCQKLHLN